MYLHVLQCRKEWKIPMRTEIGNGGVFFAVENVGVCACTPWKVCMHRSGCVHATAQRVCMHRDMFATSVSRLERQIGHASNKTSTGVWMHVGVCGCMWGYVDACVGVCMSKVKVDEVSAV